MERGSSYLLSSKIFLLLASQHTIRNTRTFKDRNYFKGALLSLIQFVALEIPLKMMKNTFYFTLIALFVLKIFKFLSSLFGHVGDGLIRKIRLVSKFMTSQPGK